MKRRQFLRNTVIAGSAIVAGQKFAWSGAKQHAGLLLEAAQFQSHGGWSLDSQFMDQMGSGFLLAHGMGIPVVDATAKVKLIETGTYKLWVRTRDWVAPWKKDETPDTQKAYGTPGIFKVLVNGEAVKTVFGDRDEDWHWQDGGHIYFSSEDVEIALHDLTGFDGRCAGIFLTKDISLIPPNHGEELAHFRRKWHGHQEKPKKAGQFDFVVVGGGLAGMCASLIAARQGLKVALIQDRPIVGGNSSSEIMVSTGGIPRSKFAPILGDILAEFDLSDEELDNLYPRGHNDPRRFLDSEKDAIVRSERNLSFFPMYRMNKVEMKKGRIVAVVAENIASSHRLQFEGQFFADCTGHGSVGYLAGADFEMSTYEHMGRCNMWAVTDTGKPTDFPSCPWAIDLSDKPFPGKRGWALRGKTEKDHNVKHLGRWFWESGFNHDPISKGEYIRDWNFRAMYGAWDSLKNVEQTFPNHKLKWSSFISGTRESRRLLGDIILNKEDVQKPVWYNDGIVPTGWKIDVHYPNPNYLKGFEGDAFISTVDFEDCVVPYYIPYRCLYSRNIPNLFMAGRDISVTREALGTVRVQRTTSLMGEVIGMAASMCVVSEVDPRDIYNKHLGELKKKFGMDPNVIAKSEKQ
ncbi:FAD-dependent oxidoreductase [uncultured Draconibacterium sp.]|mgnify:CR=1 FL=1|uniref:FAD-dependent oxidoreductase n=1 Tax=uncultured Draconibacterium sp. TaxID=1573823 RepID=UPI0025F92DBE|nr:FAD-dependent oxidoreductase [uncultured Draconibacterium sp.]